jgi:hypothetical protein
LTHVVILDSWAGDLHPDYVAEFPNVRFESWQHSSLKDEPLHGHGGWVASLVAQQSVELLKITFVRIFDRRGAFFLDDEGWIHTLAHIHALKPDYICCSWGMADGDTPLGEAMQKVMFDAAWLNSWRIHSGDADVFWAAGNDDNNDRDDDVDAPQKYTTGAVNQHIIGSDRFSGVPSSFSGDGDGVDVMYPGENTYSKDPSTGKWVKWSGTSAAAPSALGDIIANKVGKGVMIKDYWTAVASKATKYLGMTGKHNKAGRGSMNAQFEKNILYTGRWPSLTSKALMALKPTIKKWT